MVNYTQQDSYEKYLRLGVRNLTLTDVRVRPTMLSNLKELLAILCQNKNAYKSKRPVVRSKLKLSGLQQKKRHEKNALNQ